MTWDGVERRQGYVCLDKDVQEIKTDLAVVKTDVKNLDKRINGSIEDIEKHIEHGQSWRIVIVGNLIMIVIQIIAFAYLWGMQSKQVAINTDRLDVLEVVHRSK